MANWRVECTLSSPVAGELPMLDALLEYEMSQRSGLAHRVLRGDACPPAGAVHIPCLRGGLGGVNHIPRCSSPIAIDAPVTPEHFTKRLATEHANLLSDQQRHVVAIGNSTFKSYRLPLHTRRISKVVWFVGGAKRRNLLSLLDSVHSIGKKRSDGYGRVQSWEACEVEHDWSWFAPTERGTLLMRPLPWCDELPRGLIGYRRDFAGVLPPYWHPDRQMEVVVPC